MDVKPPVDVPDGDKRFADPASGQATGSHGQRANEAIADTTCETVPD